MNYTIIRQESEYQVIRRYNFLKKPQITKQFSCWADCIDYLYTQGITPKDEVKALGLSKLERVALECFKDKVGIKGEMPNY